MSIEKFLNAFEKIDRFMNKEPAPARVPEFPPIRIMQITMTPIDVFLKHLKQLVVLGALFAVFISILSFLRAIASAVHLILRKERIHMLVQPKKVQRV